MAGFHFAGARNPCAETSPLRSIPLLRPASAVLARPVHPVAPVAPLGGAIAGIAQPTMRELAERALRNAEAGLREVQNCLAVARRGIGDANRTHTRAITRRQRPGREPEVYIAAKPYTAERVRARKSAAFTLFNRRRAQLRAAVRRVAEARAALVVVNARLPA